MPNFFNNQKKNLKTYFEVGKNQRRGGQKGYEWGAGAGPKVA